MTTRARAMALDATSVEASALQTVDRVSAVQLAIIGILAERGPLTDDALADAYHARTVTHPDVPRATPQSVRSRRADLGKRGIVRATTIPGTSRYGNPATVWALAATAKEPSWIF